MTVEMNAVHESTDLVGAGGVHLRGEAWVPGEAPRAVVVIAHGKDEHIGRYRHVVSALVHQGYAVYVHDHRGHGKSGGDRGVITRFDDYVDDLDLLVGYARARNPDSLVFVLGHSMGGLIAVRYTLRFQHKLAGLVLSGPALRLGDQVPWWQKRMLLLAARFFPRKTLPEGESGVLSRDPEIERLFKSDPLCCNEPTTLGFARALYLAAESTWRRMSELNVPLLVMHGEADKLTSPLGSVSCYEEAVSKDKTLKLWAEDKHEIFNELDKSDVIAFMIDWLNERSVKRAELPPAD